MHKVYNISLFQPIPPGSQIYIVCALSFAKGLGLLTIFFIFNKHFLYLVPIHESILWNVLVLALKWSEIFGKISKILINNFSLSENDMILNE